MAKQTTKPGTGQRRKKVALKDLPKSERELSGQDARKVRGGGLAYLGEIKGESKDKDHKDEISV